ncbi:MAG: Pr6Pr family membrane protein [Gemella sp.]|nr:Pr6Pr family membrane protein [Gemella sp.]
MKFNFRLFIFLAGVLGLVLQIVNYGWAMLWYYTILSNTLVTSLMGYMAYSMYKKKNFETNNFYRFKGGVTLAISITFLVYHFVLSPLVTHEAYWNVENFLVHYIIPLGLMIDTFVFDPKNQYQKLDPVYWLGFQVAYTLIALFNGFITRIPIPGSPDSPFAYFFINIHKYGLGQVMINSLVLYTLYVVLGYIFLLTKKYLGKKNLA